jgi:hypothetical protein
MRESSVVGVFFLVLRGVHERGKRDTHSTVLSKQVFQLSLVDPQTKSRNVQVVTDVRSVPITTTHQPPCKCPLPQNTTQNPAEYIRVASPLWGIGHPDIFVPLLSSALSVSSSTTAVSVTVRRARTLVSAFCTSSIWRPPGCGNRRRLERREG